MNGLIAGILRSIPSDRIVQLLVNQVFHSELLSLGLSRFCSSFNILLQKSKNITTVQVMFEFLQTYTWAMLLWNFSMVWPNKFPTKSPSAERSLKFHWPPFRLWGFLFILFLWQLYVAINLKLHQTFGRKAHAEKG